MKRGLSRLIVIGASTGGTRVLPRLLGALGTVRASIVIIQHMPKFINDQFARSLSLATAMRVDLARDGDALEDGLILIAPSEVHCIFERNRRVLLRAGEKVNFCCPSIDVTMASLEAPLGVPTTGVILTGMGRDGAQGLLHMRRLGARTMAQDEATCAVYGMPAEAVRLGATTFEGPPDRIADLLAEPRLVAQPDGARTMPTPMLGPR